MAAIVINPPQGTKNLTTDYMQTKKVTVDANTSTNCHIANMRGVSDKTDKPKKNGKLKERKRLTWF